MADVDLIPDDYRYWLWQRRYLRRMAVVALLFIVCAVLANVGFSRHSAELRKKVGVLEIEKIQQEAEAEALARLQQQQQALQARRTLLSSLHESTDAKAALLAIDRALPGDSVWFTDLNFRHQQHLLANRAVPLPQGARIVPVEGQQLAIALLISIEGQASDHVALSTFVNRLRKEPQIAGVRLLNTSSDERQGGAIDFAVSLSLHAEVSHASDA